MFNLQSNNSRRFALIISILRKHYTSFDRGKPSNPTFDNLLDDNFSIFIGTSNQTKLPFESRIVCANNNGM